MGIEVRGTAPLFFHRTNRYPSGVQNELDIVRDVSARLERGGIEYMLTGSMAMNYYAQRRQRVYANVAFVIIFCR